nr:MAG TPA: hypothetical protein [Caudoviricetes sp.]
MRKTLIKTLKGENVKLLLYRKGNRESFEVNKAELLLYELESEIKSLGKGIVRIKDFYSLILTDVPEDIELQKGDSFGIVLDLKRSDGIYERVHINNISLIEINNYEWTFELDVNSLDWLKFKD